ITAITSPLTRIEGGTKIVTKAVPTEIRGFALDPDGNQYVTSVEVTIQNEQGQYVNVATGEWGKDPVYNPAVYNSSDAYWVLDLLGLDLPDGIYDVKGYVDDGADNIVALCRFTLDAVEDPE